MSDASSVAPARFMLSHFPIGTYRQSFLPTGSQTDFKLSPILAPFEALKQDMRVRCVPKAEARRRAEALGIRPSDIEWTPNPAFFDPMTKAHWTLVMAVAWIE